MSIVLPYVVGARVLDLFAGSGALGLEALSRGAAEAHFVEGSSVAIKTLNRNVELLGAKGLAVVHRADAVEYTRALKVADFGLAFVDPPYHKNLSHQIVRLWHEVPFASLLGVEHASDETMIPAGDTRRYGDSAVTFYGGR
jgi:16S rRNA (guanine966-N2)-methyltransferase